MLTCGVFFSFSAQAYFHEESYEHLNDFQCLTENEKRVLVEQMTIAERNAKYHYELAKNKCWWLPDLNDREKARHCFQGAIACYIGNTPQSKIVGAVIYFLTAYGLACLEEWNYINDNLMKSKVYWESYEFYKYALEHG